MVIFEIVCCHWNSLQHTRINEKRNPRCVTNLHCECQELKPKAEANRSLLVLHSSSGVRTVKTVGSHLKEARKGFFGCYSVCEMMKDIKEG